MTKSNKLEMYYFYMKGDVNEEPISLVRARSLEDAVKIFCIQKQLDEDDFLELFEVAKN
tara:strand:+ start:277 stop:453 length:177 start_codon:yes stop_codon:yes gene_type:complete